MAYLINVLHESFLSSKNVEIQERAIILMSYYLPQKLVPAPRSQFKNPNVFMGKLSPLIMRGFRQKMEGEDDDRCRLLNESALRLASEMEKEGLKWSQEMTNEMLSVNGLRYIF